MVGVPSAHSWRQGRVQGAEPEPASRGSWRPVCRAGDHKHCCQGPGAGGAAEGGGLIVGAGGLPDLQRCGVPPVRADRRALWLSFNQLNLGHLHTMTGAFEAAGKQRSPGCCTLHACSIFSSEVLCCWFYSGHCWVFSGHVGSVCLAWRFPALYVFT